MFLKFYDVGFDNVYSSADSMQKSCKVLHGKIDNGKMEQLSSHQQRFLQNF